MKITYTYAIFATKHGKAYGCFAIEEGYGMSSELLRVSASFCSPKDRNKFTKKVARDIAKGRLDSKKYIVFDRKLFSTRTSTDLLNLIKEYIRSSTYYSPEWARDCINKNTVYLTLRRNRDQTNMLLSGTELV